MMTSLSNAPKLPITVVAIDWHNHDLTRQALETTVRAINPQSILVISDRNLMMGAGWIETTVIDDYAKRDEILLKGLSDLVQTDYAITVTHEHAIRGITAWDPDFRNYDYIGHGGLTLRSRKFMESCLDNRIGMIPGWTEAQIIEHNRERLQQVYAVRFAPQEMAQKWAALV
jgi:hypothetical protein